MTFSLKKDLSVLSTKYKRIPKLKKFQAVAKKLASGKLSMSAVGNLSTVPYLDTL